MASAGFLILFSVVVTSASGIIDDRLENRYKLKGAGSRENVLASFTPSITEVIDEINGMTFPSLAAKRTALTNAQQVFTKRVQESVQRYLTRRGAKFESFWINNKMIIKDAGYSLLRTLIFYPGVAKIELEPVVQLAMSNGATAELDVALRKKQGQSFRPWGIRNIRADLVWKTFTGQGVVVAGIDTGVRHTHEALQFGWRRFYGWFDPAGKTATPYDNHGHGTHTMGTIVGVNGIGVAPGALWIACKGCSTGQNCEFAPHIVSNSWGADDGESGKWYDEIILSWQPSGIVPVFSNGNSGPGCSTTGSPGGRPGVISVGSTDPYGKISFFSSIGPSSDGKLKPDIVAPGSLVLSAWPTTDSSYELKNGTSVTCPHVAGVIALMLEKNPKLTYKQIYKAITNTAERNSLDTEDLSVLDCGFTSSSIFPNIVFGHGQIDAVKSVNAV